MGRKATAFQHNGLECDRRELLSIASPGEMRNASATFGSRKTHRPQGSADPESLASLEADAVPARKALKDDLAAAIGGLGASTAPTAMATALEERFAAGGDELERSMVQMRASMRIASPDEFAKTPVSAAASASSKR